MKKLFSILLSFAMVLGMGSVALADGEVETLKKTTQSLSDMDKVTITKEYQLKNEGTSSPDETFNFTIERTSVTDASAGTVAKLSAPKREGEILMPIPTIDTVHYTKGEAGPTTANKKITVSLPTYKSVGIYTYTIKEIDGNKAGVTYFGKNIKLVVTVTQGEEGLVRTAAVHTEDENGTKSDSFQNVYSAGNLEISKLVTGNLGDKSKYFDVTVTLTGEEGKIYEESYPVDGGSIAAGSIKVGIPTIFKIKDGDTITIKNLPYGLAYTVVEEDYTGSNGGYEEAKYDFSDEEESKLIDNATETIEITNEKTADVDTGISLDSIPYILLLGFAVLGMGALFFRRRQNTSF